MSCSYLTQPDQTLSYGTEPAIGQALSESGVDRSEIFITTKLWNNAHHPEDVEPALDASLKNLGTSYIGITLLNRSHSRGLTYTISLPHALALPLRTLSRAHAQERRQDQDRRLGLRGYLESHGSACEKGQGEGYWCEQFQPEGAGETAE